MRIKVLYLLKGINCYHDYSAFKKYTVYRGLGWNTERENDPRADRPGGLAYTLSTIIVKEKIFLVLTSTKLWMASR